MVTPAASRFGTPDFTGPVELSLTVPRMPGYSAHRPGEPPSSGTSVLGGVELPAGRRYTGANGTVFWATDDYLERCAPVASQLALQFSETGLWPLGWSWESQSPAAYSTEDVDLDVVEALDAGEVLRSASREYGFDPHEFPGLAEPSSDRDAIDALNPSH